MDAWKVKAFSKFIIRGNYFKYFVVNDGMLII
jgi:hypothetical protein